MDTLAQIYAKIVASGRFCDRGTVHSYVDYYETLLAPYRDAAKKILEIGIYDGGGLEMLEAYFFNAEVHGVDCSLTPHDKVDLRPMIAEGKHNIHIFNAEDEAEAEKRFSGMRFDVIIEDANHSLYQQLRLHDVWMPYLSSGGLYVIEDIDELEIRCCHFEALDFEIIDRRNIKGRFDDVIAVKKF